MVTLLHCRAAWNLPAAPLLTEFGLLALLTVAHAHVLRDRSTVI